MRALRQKTHISHRMVAYSIHDPALLEANDEEVVKEYERTRNIDVLTVTKDMIKFTLAPISAALYEGINSNSRIDPRVFHMLDNKKRLIKEIENRFDMKIDEWEAKQWAFYNFSLGEIEDGYTTIEKNLLKSFDDLPRKMQRMWFQAGVVEIRFGSEVYSIEEFEDNIQIDLYPKIRGEMAELVKELSELGPSLGK